MTDGRVKVTGAASRTMAPDSATWRAETVETGTDARAAYERCTAGLNALVERLAAVGEVATDAVVVQPRFDERGPSGVEAIGAVRVRCPAERAGEVAQAAMAAGGNRLHGPWFHFEDEDAVREELLAEAVVGARRKAERLAGAAGRRLGGVLAVDESGEREYGVVATAAVAGGEPPDVRPREQRVTSHVTVVFALMD